MVEHHIDVLMGLVDKVAVMYFGTIIAYDTPQNVMADPTVQSAYLGTGCGMTDGRLASRRDTRPPGRESSRSAASAARSRGSRSSRTSRSTCPATGITAILGRNGVGKTSTLRGILGLIQRRGEVVLAGERIDGLSTHRIVQRGRRLRSRGPRDLLEADRR